MVTGSWRDGGSGWKGQGGAEWSSNGGGEEDREAQERAGSGVVVSAIFKPPSRPDPPSQVQVDPLGQHRSFPCPNEQMFPSLKEVSRRQNSPTEYDD